MLPADMELNRETWDQCEDDAERLEWCRRYVRARHCLSTKQAKWLLSQAEKQIE